MVCLNMSSVGSEPSLLSETSKQVAVSQSSGDNVSSSNSPTSEQITAQTVSPVHSQHGRQSDLNLFSSDKYIHDSEFFPNDTSPRTPSYLRISSIVNGYGPYIKYTAYKGIERRSPFSSTLSLRSSRSDLTTPVSPAEMPIGKIPNVQAPTNYPPVKNEILSPKLKSPNGLPCEGDAVDSGSVTPVINGANCELSRVNGNHVASDGENGIAVNGQNGHNIGLVENFVSTGDPQQDTEYFLSLTQREEARLLMLCSRCEMELCADTISEEVSGKIRAAVGKANLLINQKFKQFQELCHQHTHPDPEGKPTKWEDLQGFWEMVKIQVDDVDLSFTEIDMMRQNGWQEIKIPSRRSSSSSRSSPKSSSLNVSNTSTPSHTPGSKRRANRMKDTPESSPERSLKAKMAAKERDDARKKMLAEKRAAMKQQRQQEDGEGVEIYVPDDSSKSASPARSTGSDV